MEQPLEQPCYCDVRLLRTSGVNILWSNYSKWVLEIYQWHYTFNWITVWICSDKMKPFSNSCRYYHNKKVNWCSRALLTYRNYFLYSYILKGFVATTIEITTTIEIIISIVVVISIVVATGILSLQLLAHIAIKRTINAFWSSIVNEL